VSTKIQSSGDKQQEEVHMASSKDQGVADPRYTIIVAGDDGKYYKINREQWQTEANEVKDAGGAGMLDQLTRFGTYLAHIPPDLAVGIGHICTIVNLKAVLKDQGKDDPKKDTR
jgi:hypothetical protein